MFLARGLGCVLSWQPAPIVHELFSLAFQVAYPLSGYGNAAFGLELDTIASVVIGGTLLTGGMGTVIGTLIGVLILGLIQTFISSQGAPNVFWTKIFIGRHDCRFTLRKAYNQMALIPDQRMKVEALGEPSRGEYDRSRFGCRGKTDSYVCPQGKKLRRNGAYTINGRPYMRYANPQAQLRMVL